MLLMWDHTLRSKCRDQGQHLNQEVDVAIWTNLHSCKDTDQTHMQAISLHTLVKVITCFLEKGKWRLQFTPFIFLATFLFHYCTHYLEIQNVLKFWLKLFQQYVTNLYIFCLYTQQNVLAVCYRCAKKWTFPPSEGRINST